MKKMSEVLKDIFEEMKTLDRDRCAAVRHDFARLECRYVDRIGPVEWCERRSEAQRTPPTARRVRDALRHRCPGFEVDLETGRIDGYGAHRDWRRNRTLKVIVRQAAPNIHM